MNSNYGYACDSNQSKYFCDLHSIKNPISKILFKKKNTLKKTEHNVSQCWELNWYTYYFWLKSIFRVTCLRCRIRWKKNLKTVQQKRTGNNVGKNIQNWSKSSSSIIMWLRADEKLPTLRCKSINLVIFLSVSLNPLCLNTVTRTIFMK